MTSGEGSVCWLKEHTWVHQRSACWLRWEWPRSACTSSLWWPSCQQEMRFVHSNVSKHLHFIKKINSDKYNFDVCVCAPSAAESRGWPPPRKNQRLQPFHSAVHHPGTRISHHQPGHRWRQVGDFYLTRIKLYHQTFYFHIKEILKKLVKFKYSMCKTHGFASR